MHCLFFLVLIKIPSEKLDIAKELFSKRKATFVESSKMNLNNYYAVNYSPRQLSGQLSAKEEAAFLESNQTPSSSSVPTAPTDEGIRNNVDPVSMPPYNQSSSDSSSSSSSSNADDLISNVHNTSHNLNEDEDPQQLQQQLSRLDALNLNTLKEANGDEAEGGVQVEDGAYDKIDDLGDLSEEAREEEEERVGAGEAFKDIAKPRLATVSDSF
jgi:hypothetical protein